MTIPTPLQDALEAYNIPLQSQEIELNREGAATGTYQEQPLAEFLPWGDQGCFILATAGIVELEYASIQKGCGVFDASCRGTLEVKGDDRFEFVDRLSTQKFEQKDCGDSMLTFIVSRKGKIIADAIVHVQENRLLLDVDITSMPALIAHCNEYIVMEDVTLQEITDECHWLWCIGPKSDSIDVECLFKSKLPIGFLGLHGYAIATSPTQTVSVWEEILTKEVRPIGWFALNMARVEQGAAIFLIDFDTSNLPHESSLIDSRVRFDKGCYLGQEIVARMESLGKPKQKLVQLHLKSNELPIAGAQLWENNSGNGTPIGVVTSSAVSPKRSGESAVIAMVSKKFAIEGTMVYVYVGADLFESTVLSLQSSSKGVT